MTATELIQNIAEGKTPQEAVHVAINEGVSGPERRDIDYAEKEAMFAQLIQQSESNVPYLNHEYVDQVLGQIRSGAPAQELIALASKNRGDALAAGADVGAADFASWDAVHRALMTTFTDELPPTIPG